MPFRTGCSFQPSKQKRGAARRGGDGKRAGELIANHLRRQDRGRKPLFPWLIVLALTCPFPSSAETLPRPSVDGPIETVFSWRTQRCDDNFIPDSPARAFRRADGTIALLAAHFTNGFLTGPSFDKLKPNCAVTSKGHEADSAEEFDTRYWIQALWPLPGGRVLGLGSHEYLGRGKPGGCEIGGGALCWYSAIVKSVARESGLKFELLPLPHRLAAAPPMKHDPKAAERRGFFTASNVVSDGRWAYFASWHELPGNRRGNCLFRAPLEDLEGDWLALRDGGFTQLFPDPYRSSAQSIRDAACDIIGKNVLRGPLRSIVRIKAANIWIGVFQYTTRSDNRAASGTFASFSSDLINWSEPQLVFPSRQPWGQKECGQFYEYPSLIDEESASTAFDTAGDRLHLYLTRFNYQGCAKGLDRDLVRIGLRVDVRR
jgi:hypothetical protein